MLGYVLFGEDSSVPMEICMYLCQCTTQMMLINLGRAQNVFSKPIFDLIYVLL
jgi:hypothetical protein